MKNYDEIANIVFERREQYETEKKKKKQVLTRTLVPLCCVCLVAVLGFAAQQGGLFDKQPTQNADGDVPPFTEDEQDTNYDETPSTIAQNGENHSAADDSQADKTQSTQAPKDNGVATDNNTTTTVNQEILVESYVYQIKEGKFSIYIGGKVIAEDKIGDKISDVTLSAGWKKSIDDKWLTQETLRGEVFAIKGVTDDTAVALKFIDKGDAVTTTHYYVITNPKADLSAVEDYTIPRNDS